MKNTDSLLTTIPLVPSVWKFSPGQGCSRNCIQIIDANKNQTQFKVVFIDKATNEDSFAIQMLLEYPQNLIS